MSEAPSRGDDMQWLTTLAGGLVHEIKNPLSTLNLNLQLLKEDWVHVDDPNAGRSLRKIDILLKEVRRLESILNDFLRYVRGFNVSLEDCDVNGIVDEVLDFMAPELEQGSIRLWKSLDAKLPKTQLDPDLFKQAFLNLIINAKQAMPEGGELMIRTLQSRAGIVIEITDTGRGMSAEQKTKIFNAYFSTRKGGTGL